MSIWFTSDTHFGHENILKFRDGAGMNVRPGFSSADEMDEAMIDRWNALVKPGDHVWHLGDVGFGDVGRLQANLKRLNGAKRLCLGNHDDLKRQGLAEHFSKIQLWRMFTEHGFVCSHIPLPQDQFRFKVRLNLHGHIHQQPDPSENHWNISVERTDYGPVHLDEVVAQIKARGI